PRHKFVHGIRAYRTVEEIPDDVDLAIIMVPRDAVMSVINGCGRKKVKGVVVVTAGYREIGKEGEILEDELIRVVRSYKMRMIGPNCFGVMNMSQDVRMNATFTAYDPTPGPIGFVSQSGGLGEILIDRAEREGLGMAQFASIGNRADVTGTDILKYWEDEEEIKAIFLYLENIGDPREFGKMARRISRLKPIITLKAGRTSRGAVAASSHTGALADEDAANQAIFEQYGVIRVNSLETLFQVGALLVNQPPSRGRNVAVITNAGGPGILATDALISQGLNIPEISDEGKAKLKKVLRPECSLRNPIDVIASGGKDEYRAALEVAFEQEDIDSVIVLFIPVIMVDALEVAEVIAEFSARWQKPIQVVWLARGKIHGLEAEQCLRKRLIPMYEMPVDAAQALILSVNYYEWKNKSVGKEIIFKVEHPKARGILKTAQSENRTSLTDIEAMKLVGAYGISTVPTIYANSRDEALGAAQKIGYPVVLKASRPGLMHKTDVGGVILDIHDPTGLMDAWNRIDENLTAHNLREGSRFLIQPMVDIGGEGIECVLGLRNLKKYGPMIMFGLGGIYIEILKAVGFRMVPLTNEDARELVMQSPAWPILAGARGKKPIDLDKLVENILRLGQLASDNPEISEVDLNPFVIYPDGAKNIALDQVVVILGK
ncbi:MAG: acetate--CoA ligase family protein, partial [bacterium]